MSNYHEQISAALAGADDCESRLQATLQILLREFSSETATVHRLEAGSSTLKLVAQIGLPPVLLPVVQSIPVGKGIAGETVVRNGPVTICNLQTDTSGVAKAGAKQTGVGGALSVPIRQAGAVVGTLGIGTKRQYEFTAEETARLESVASLIAEHGLA
jgi:putative methionine-R-sulfoxide reductase with GAF domain